MSFVQLSIYLIELLKSVYCDNIFQAITTEEISVKDPMELKIGWERISHGSSLCTHKSKFTAKGNLRFQPTLFARILTYSFYLIALTIFILFAQSTNQISELLMVSFMPLFVASLGFWVHWGFIKKVQFEKSSQSLQIGLKRYHFDRIHAFQVVRSTRVFINPFKNDNGVLETFELNAVLINKKRVKITHHNNSTVLNQDILNLVELLELPVWSNCSTVRLATDSSDFTTEDEPKKNLEEMSSYSRNTSPLEIETFLDLDRKYFISNFGQRYPTLSISLDAAFYISLIALSFLIFSHIELAIVSANYLIPIVEIVVSLIYLITVFTVKKRTKNRELIERAVSKPVYMTEGVIHPQTHNYVKNDTATSITTYELHHTAIGVLPLFKGHASAGRSVEVEFTYRDRDKSNPSIVAIYDQANRLIAIDKEHAFGE